MKSPSVFLFAIAASILLPFDPDLRGQTTPNVATVYTFTNHTDGADPFAGLVQGSDGNFYGTTSGAAQNTNGSSAKGTVYRITPTGVFTTLHSFTGTDTDGAFPSAGLIQGSDGNFYGTTSEGGGTTGGGTVYRITPAGEYTTLHSFTDKGTDGNNAQSGLIQGSDGNFYGTTYFGGNDRSNNPNGSGTVYRITPAGEYTTLHSFTGTSTDGEFPLAGLIQGSDGNFYGTTSVGGSNGSGTVFKTTPAGILTTLYSFSKTDNNNGNSDGAYPSAGVIQGSDGNFYGTTVVGGVGRVGTAYRLTPMGVLTTLHSFTGTGTDGAGPSAGLVQGNDGNFYGTTPGGGSSTDGTIYRITPAGGYATLHSFTGIGTDGAGPVGALIQATDGNFYGVTQYYGGSNQSGYGTVFKLGHYPAITSATTATATLGKAFSYQITATNGPTSYGVQGLPAGITVNSKTGLVSGTPKTAGKVTLMLNAYNSAGKGSTPLILTIQGAPVISSATTATSAQGEAFSYLIEASNSPTSYGVQGLPPGLTVNTKTGLISGTVSGVGKVTLTLNAYNAAGKGSAILTLTVKAVSPVITSAATAAATVGQAFNYQIAATNHPTSFGVQGLPSGLAVDSSTGLISGTPKGAGKFSLTLNAYNGAGKGSATLVVTVAAQ